MWKTLRLPSSLICSRRAISYATHSSLPALDLTDALLTATHRRIFGSTDNNAFTLHPILTPEECKRLILATEQLGYEQALLNVGNGNERINTDVRRSQRCVVDSQLVSEQMFHRIQKFLPNDAKGLNPRLRFLKYLPGDRFLRHRDGSYKDAASGLVSKYTFQIYLNEDCQGGETSFWSSTFVDGKKEQVDVVPKEGLAVVFEHRTLHEGRVVTEGCKYALRTDILVFPE
ncbi:hypothetical protein DFS34DRAFT_428543 [Phlyctochytrium arcticum]|nr:hypothetical protein DFS34DRAFT_428543 [Phlyctochytrium arcticum]